ncbi:MAG: hypothetical protein M3024_12320 [Candidatus Dormibacteraeota bacterium]|nr:hypothetical protein [Candidatus Dormibacteraeota bacterium]
MNRLVRLAVASAGMVGTIIALGAAPAAAQEPPPNFEINTFEIEAKTNYCQGGGSACLPPSGDLSKLRFADVTVWRFSPVKSSAEGDADRDGNSRSRVTGKPELLNIKCAWNHYIDANGAPHAYSIGLLGATAGAGLPFPTVSVDGTATVLHGSEASKRAVGRLDLRAWDEHGTSAEVEGTQVTDNTATPFPTRISGGFEVHLKGTIMDENIATQTSTVVGPGETSCRTNVQSVIVPGASPPDFESEMNDNGDAS